VELHSVRTQKNVWPNAAGNGAPPIPVEGANDTATDLARTFAACLGELSGGVAQRAARQRGEGITPEEPSEPRGDNVVDLIAALKRSLGQDAKPARKGLPQQRTGGGRRKKDSYTQAGVA
jgi:hypothetical protein